MEYIVESLFFVSFLCGWIFVGVAALMRYPPPKEINGLYGYRTASSMKNQQQWEFAQRYAAGAMARAGIAMIMLSLSGFFIEIDKLVKEGLGMFLLLGACVYMIVSTEKAIKKKFGSHKNN